MKDLQRIFYEQLLDEKYNPDSFLFHLTLHIDKDYEKVVSIQNKLIDVFKPFLVEFSRLGLFNYQGKLIEEFEISDSK